MHTLIIHNAFPDNEEFNKDNALLTKSIRVSDGDNLLKVLHDNNIYISAPCGGSGVCGKCKVKFVESFQEYKLTEIERNILSEKELDENIRLACKIQIKSNLEIELVKSGENGGIEIMTNSLNKSVEINSGVLKERIKLNKPIQQRDYLQSFLKEVSGKNENRNISLAENIYFSLTDLSEVDEIICTYFEDKVIDIEDIMKATESIYGIAVDIGTTTVAIYLMDLISGDEKDVISFHNPQYQYGADVISRITYTQNNERGIKELQEILINKINLSLQELIEKNSIRRRDIYIGSIVGNTVMIHTLMGLSAYSIAVSPYKPLFIQSLKINSSLLGLDINPGGYILIPPSISAYIGADIVGDMLAAEFEEESWTLMIDIGTNGEIVLGRGNHILACSAAAGPAFEGAGILYGMAGLPGAISEYRISDDDKKYETIGSKPALGICGSGLIDLISALYHKNIIDESGSFSNMDDMNTDTVGDIIIYKGSPAYRVLSEEESGLEDDILLTQKDIRQFQMAMGAIAAGTNILIKEAGIDIDQIKKVYLAGGFGNHINPENAAAIGLIPESLKNRTIKIGNAAGMGAKLYFLNKEYREKAELLAEKVKYIELSTRPDFQEEYMKAMYFPDL
ncbi:MAG: ASKHA domain-containing protein [Bacillota bacterium]